MNRIDKLIRGITIPPIVAGVMVLLLYFASHSIDLKDFVIAEICLVFIPFLAYPYGIIAHGNKDVRETQRNAALILSGVGYAVGFVCTFIFSSSIAMRVLFSAYIISIAGLLFINKVIKFKASGHSCSTTAPIVMLTWQMGTIAVIPGVLLITAVYFSSLKLKRHTLTQLIVGSFISLVAAIVAISMFTI